MLNKSVVLENLEQLSSDKRTLKSTKALKAHAKYMISLGVGDLPALVKLTTYKTKPCIYVFESISCMTFEFRPLALVIKEGGIFLTYKELSKQLVGTENVGGLPIRVPNEGVLWFSGKYKSDTCTPLTGSEIELVLLGLSLSEGKKEY